MLNGTQTSQECFRGHSTPNPKQNRCGVDATLLMGSTNQTRLGNFLHFFMVRLQYAKTALRTFISLMAARALPFLVETVL